MNKVLTYLRRRFISTTFTSSYKVEGPSGCTGQEGKGGGGKYKAASLLAIPIIIGLSVLFVVYRKEPKREPFVRYEYMRRRSKRFPWGDGDKSFFHNPKYNALSGGYEYELDDEEEPQKEEEDHP